MSLQFIPDVPVFISITLFKNSKLNRIRNRVWYTSVLRILPHQYVNAFDREAVLN